MLGSYKLQPVVSYPFFLKTPFKLDMFKFSCSGKEGKFCYTTVFCWVCFSDFFGSVLNTLIYSIKAPYVMKLYHPPFPSDFLSSPNPWALPGNEKSRSTYHHLHRLVSPFYLGTGWEEEVVQFC